MSSPSKPVSSPAPRPWVIPPAAAGFMYVLLQRGTISRGVESEWLNQRLAERLPVRVPLSHANVVVVQFATLRAPALRGITPREALLFGPGDAVVGSVQEAPSGVEILDFEERTYCTVSERRELWRPVFHVNGESNEPIGCIRRRRFRLEVMQLPIERGQPPIAILSGRSGGPCEHRNGVGEIVSFITEDTPRSRADRRRGFVWKIEFSDIADPLDRKIGLAAAWVMYETNRRAMSSD